MIISDSSYSAIISDERMIMLFGLKYFTIHFDRSFMSQFQNEEEVEI